MPIYFDCLPADGISAADMVLPIEGRDFGKSPFCGQPSGAELLSKSVGAGFTQIASCILLEMLPNRSPSVGKDLRAGMWARSEISRGARFGRS